MKKSILIILAFALFFQLNAQNSRRVLFIGNSYIYTNDMPNMLKTLAAGCGDTLIYSQSTPGGCTFQSHLSNSNTMNYINEGGWDNVVLQEQSQYPSFPIGQVQNMCFPYAAQLCEKVRAASPDAQVTFFMTWGRKNGDAQNCAEYPPLCTYEGMDSLLALRYMMMAEMNDAAVAPVGRVWRAIREQHPEIELYNADESHPSVAGSYAAALTFYTLIFHHSPTCISNDLSLSADVAQILRETVETVVYDSLTYWLAWWEYSDIEDVIVGNECTSDLKVYPNPTHDVLHVQWAAADVPSISLSLVDVCGKLIQQLTAEGNSAEVNLSDFPSGLYFVRVMLSSGASETVKVVRE